VNKHNQTYPELLFLQAETRTKLSG